MIKYFEFGFCPLSAKTNGRNRIRQEAKGTRITSDMIGSNTLPSERPTEQELLVRRLPVSKQLSTEPHSTYMSHYISTKKKAAWVKGGIEVGLTSDRISFFSEGDSRYISQTTLQTSKAPKHHTKTQQTKDRRVLPRLSYWQPGVPKSYTT